MDLNAKYITEKQDDRDGGKTVVLVSVIDNITGATMGTKIAVFENSKAANDYAEWMNSRPTKQQ